SSPYTEAYVVNQMLSDTFGSFGSQYAPSSSQAPMIGALLPTPRMPDTKVGRSGLVVVQSAIVSAFLPFTRLTTLPTVWSPWVQDSWSTTLPPSSSNFFVNDLQTFTL